MIYIGKEIENRCLKNGIKDIILRDDIDENGIDFAHKLLEPDFEKRITADEALNHPFLQSI